MNQHRCRKVVRNNRCIEAGRVPLAPLPKATVAFRELPKASENSRERTQRAQKGTGRPEEKTIFFFSKNGYLYLLLPDFTYPWLAGAKFEDEDEPPPGLP